MILLYHSNTKITRIVTSENQLVNFDSTDAIGNGMQKLAHQFPEEIIVWCHENCSQYVNLNAIDGLFLHHRMMLSFNPNGSYLFDKYIGYVEESPFIKINNVVTYPTWRMSSYVGVISASVLIQINTAIQPSGDFEYYLNSIAKIAMPQGLFCYSVPDLLLKMQPVSPLNRAVNDTFKFVKQHYKTRWVLLLFLNMVLFEKRFPIMAFLKCLMYKSRTAIKIDFNRLPIAATSFSTNEDSVDVIIPTIGRKNYLYDVLIDFKNQTTLPKNVIIVEQNPISDSTSSLDYLQTEKWPFTIKHTFTHQTGACNARNIAMQNVESKWIFFADDDIRFDPNLIKDTLKKLHQFQMKVATILSFQKHDNFFDSIEKQWESFGSGCSFMKSTLRNTVQFNAGFEFGYGEDSDFGMQLRNIGADILYLPNPKIEHLKAPVGGFRMKPNFEWDHEQIQPKPSPTVLLYKFRHHSKQQIRGYKITLFFKYYKNQKIKNPFVYYSYFKKQWNQSVFYAHKLQSLITK